MYGKPRQSHKQNKFNARQLKTRIDAWELELNVILGDAYIVARRQSVLKMCGTQFFREHIRALIALM